MFFLSQHQPDQKLRKIRLKLFILLQAQNMNFSNSKLTD